MCIFLSYLCLLKVSLPTFFSKKVGILLPDKFEFKASTKKTVAKAATVFFVYFASSIFSI